MPTFDNAFECQTKNSPLPPKGGGGMPPFKPCKVKIDISVIAKPFQEDTKFLEFRPSLNNASECKNKIFSTPPQKGGGHAPLLALYSKN